MTRLPVSVVVVVHGRHDHLARMLAALAGADDAPSEVVVVTMADAEAGARARAVAAATGLPVAVVPLDADPARLPLARARNTGAAAARQPVVVFLDVDCLADPALLTRYHDAVTGPRPAGAPTGPIAWCGPVTYLPEGAAESAWATGAGLDAPIDWGVLRALRSPHAARPDPGAGHLVPEPDLRLFWSLSFAMTGADVRAAGGFDEAYTGYGGEDTDFARRLDAAGGGIVWVGGADAYHQHHPVSRPPVEHVDDIVRNTGLFRERWGEDCMTGWLEEFERRGLVRRTAAGWERA